MKRKRKRLSGFLLGIALVLAMIPGISQTAYAGDAEQVETL